ncbi:hypothetical protein TNCV_1561191 [Trichonephila clavipes]|nr:hypothetical protein TNCV_1561191 [Trichonephila clavipes]
MYDNGHLTCALVFQVQVCFFFCDGGEDAEDNLRPSRHSMSKSDVNIENIGYLARFTIQFSIRVIAETVEIDEESVRQILQRILDGQDRQSSPRK